MDAKRRAVGFSNLVKVIGQSQIQCVLVTPNDVDLAPLDKKLQDIIGIVRMDGVGRDE